MLSQKTFKSIDIAIFETWSINESYLLKKKQKKLSLNRITESSYL
jgi:hypothetical protein